MPTTALTIDAPIDDVWRHLTAPQLMARWMPGVANLRSADGRQLGPGSTLLFDARGATHESRVIDCRPSELLVLESTQGAVTATYTYRLAPDPESGGVQVELGIHCVARGPVRIIAPLIRLLIWFSDRSQPQRLSAVLNEQGR